MATAVSNPRDVINNVGAITREVLTFDHHSDIVWSSTAGGHSAQSNLAVTMHTDDNKVQLAGAGELVLGRLVQLEGGSGESVASIQVGGVMNLPAGDNDTGAIGKRVVGDTKSAAEGYVKRVADAATPTAAEVNLVLKGRGIVLADGSITVDVNGSAVTAITVYLND